MENIHNAIAWYQKKIGSYDKQLWEQSVERKLQKGLPNAHHAPRKTVRLKTEFIDVDLIRGSTFTKTKPQVPWIYITRKAFVRVLFFPFYYRWWVLQSSRKVFYLLLLQYLLQATTAFVYFFNLDGSIVEDELTLTEVVVPMGLMFLLGLIHAQTVLAHFSLKPPRRDGRHGSVSSNSKQKKRGQRAGSNPLSQDTNRGGSAQPQNPTDSTDNIRHFRRSHRHTASLWNIPRVEVEPSEISSAPTLLHPSPSSSRKNVAGSVPPAQRSARLTKRGEKKSVRIVDSLHKLTPKSSPTNSGTTNSVSAVSVSATKLSGETMNGSSSVVGGSPVRNGERDCGAKLNGESDSAKGEVLMRKEAGGRTTKIESGGAGTSEGSGSRDLITERVGEIQNCDARRLKDAADRSSSGFEDCCESGAMYEENDPCSLTIREQDTPTDSDSVVGRFEFVVPCCSSERKKDSLSSDDFSLLSGCQGQQQQLQQGKPWSVAASLAEEQMLGGSRVQEISAAEHSKDEDNLSDTGHVSNSSNYNPSDSGSEAENCDDEDCRVGMPVPKSPLSKSPRSSPTCVEGSVASASLSNQSLNASPRKMAQQQQLEGESSASDPGSPDARQTVSGVRRRRRTSANQQGGQSGEGGTLGSEGGGAPSSSSALSSSSSRPPRPLPPKLLSVRAQSKVTQTSGVSSSENEAAHNAAEAVNKATISSEEWEDRMQSDVTTSSSYSTSNSESELSENEGTYHEEFPPPEDDLVHEGLTSSSFHDINLLQPPNSTNLASHNSQPDKVSCVIWEGNECQKLDLTALDIGWAIIDKVDNLPESSDYIFIGVAFSLCLGCVPLVYRFYCAKDVPQEVVSLQAMWWLWALVRKNSWGQNLIITNGFLQRLVLSCIFFFLLTVTDRTFKQRLLYAKHFSYLTSSRRARKFDMPHFRLNKVRNIKIWLSLRSYLKRRGPQRSVDVIVSASFYLTISLVCLMCIQMLKDSETYLDFLCNWELVVWCLALGIYIMRFMTLGLKINKKYRNLSVLITEQINLYLQMEQKPHKKEELTLANNVLRLAEDLLKELESPFKISGFSANPLVYNITKVVVLSAFSAVMTEMLGFKLKLYKIKFK